MSNFSNFKARVKSMSLKRMNMYIAQIHKNYGANRLFTAADMCVCAAKRGIGYLDYTVFGFAKVKGAKRDTFLTYNKNVALSSMANDPQYTPFFKDKLKFDEAFSEFIGREWLNLEKADEKEFAAFCKKHKTVFAKYPLSFGGQQIEKIETDESTDFSALYKKLKENGQVLIEEKIKQHPAMNALCPSSVNSIRIVTLRDKNGAVHYLYSLLRFGNGTKAVDNITSGGMYLLLDKNGKSASKAFCDKTGLFYDAHPMTGTDLLNFEVPMHGQAVELCKKGADVVPQVGYIGWDVAVTENGPVLIEGNVLPGYDMFQNYNLSGKDTGILPVIHAIPGYEKL